MNYDDDDGGDDGCKGMKEKTEKKIHKSQNR